MSDPTNLIAEQIDRAVGAPPPSAVDLEGLLRSGRRAQGRRRLAVGAGTAAAAIAVGGTAWALVPDGGDTSSGQDLPFATAPSDAPMSEGASDSGAPYTGNWMAGAESAYLTEDHTLLTKPGWRIAERIDDPAGPGSLAVAMSKGDRQQWFMWSADLGMMVSILRAPEEGFASFGDWVETHAPAVRASSDGPAQPDPKQTEGEWPGVPRDDLVRFDGTGALVPLAAVSIIDQRKSPDVGASFATAEDTSAVALVETEGARWFVLARIIDAGPPQYIAVPAAKGGTTIPEFLEFARARYTEGGGGLL